MGKDTMKTYTTARLMLDLSKRDKDDCEPIVFEAPSTALCYQQRATLHSDYAHFEERSEYAPDGSCESYKWVNDTRPTYRRDWVQVKPAPKPKRERIRVGEVSVIGSDVHLNNVKAFCELENGKYDLVAVKR
jgi:hypothetical protein